MSATDYYSLNYHHDPVFFPKFLSSLMRFLLLVMLISFNLLTSFSSSFAMKAQEHEELTAAYAGGMRYYQYNGITIVRDIHSKIIDKVPWRNIYFKIHQELWGHSEAWYYGRPEAYKIIVEDLIKNKAMTPSQALDLAHKYLPTGGGRILIMNEISKIYGYLLNQEEIGAIVDQVHYTHLAGDKGWLERNKMTEKVNKWVAHPPRSFLDAKLKLDLEYAWRSSGLSESNFVTVFSNTIDNYERWFVSRAARSFKGSRLFNVADAKLFGLSIGGTDYLVSLRSDKGWIIRSVNKFGKPILVTSEAFKKLMKDPKGKELIQKDLIKTLKSELPEKVVDNLNHQSFKKYVDRNLQKVKNNQTQGLSTFGNKIKGRIPKSCLSVINAVGARYANVLNKVPRNLHAPIQGGLLASIISGTINTFGVLQGDVKADEALLNTLEDTVLATSSIYISDAFFQNVGNGRFALTTIAKETSTLCRAFGAGINYGVATFIFDETGVLWSFINADISEKEFYKQTGEAVLKSIGTGGATYCAVALGLSATGPVVMAIGMGTYVLVNQGIASYRKIEKRNYLFVEDILGHLPLEMQNRITPWDRYERITPWDQPSKQTPWNRPQNVTPWD